MMTGEYFLSEKVKENIEREKKREQKELKKQDKIDKKNANLVAPEDTPLVAPIEVAKVEASAKKSSKPDIDELKKKFLKKSK